VLELTGCKPEDGMQGRSLVSLLHGGHFNPPASLYIESMYGKEEMNWAPLTGIIDGPYKYISLPEPELYQLENDPAEKNNLVRVKSNVSRNLDKKLGELVLRYSRASGDSKRDLSKKDIQHLQSLGYISAFSGKTGNSMDPKKGIIINNRIKVISRKIKQNKLDEAEKEINAIVKETPEMISYALISQQFSLYLARNQVEKALDSLKAGIKRFPEQVNFRTLMCQVLYDNKMYQEVLDQCREIVRIDPNCTWAFILQGDSFEQLNDLQKAEDNYLKALKLEPENVSMKIRYAELLLKEKKFDQALEAYNSVLANRDVWDTPQILYKIALFNTAHGTLGKAEELMRRIIQLEPGGKNYYMFALILAKNQKLAEALQNMEIAVDRYGDQLNSGEKENARQAIQVWKENQ
jgi:tetratricopeptide (TPR) repeat protein